MVRLLIPGDHVRTVACRGWANRWPLLRDGDKKLGEGVDDRVVGQSFADRDGEGGSRPPLSASLHAGRSSSRTRTRFDSLRISSSTDFVRGSVDTIERAGSRRNLGGFMNLLVCMVRVSHAPKIGPL
jgi:hypothetical protein